MFTKDTVIILGAGASCHYGYPTGEKLVEKIVALASEIHTEYAPIKAGAATIYKDSRYRPIQYRDDAAFENFLSELKTIKERIREANPLVIDFFLGDNSDIADVGRLLIAMVLLECEQKNHLPPPKKKDSSENLHDEDDWLRFVVHQLTIGCEEPKWLLDNKVTFVTFNYDMSLERRLHLALKHYKRFSDDGFADGFFNDGRIYHVYGQLRDFNPNTPSKSQVPTILDEPSALAGAIDSAYEASKKLRTIAPKKSVATSELTPAIDAIKKAKYLYFLGYGFDSHNNTLLELGELHETPRNQQRINFTNLGNHNKINRKVAAAFHMPPDSLMGEKYLASEAHYRVSCEKSIHKVYRALAEDFDWPN